MFSIDLNSFHYSFAIFSSLAYLAISYMILDMVKENGKMLLLTAAILMMIPLFDVYFIVTRNDAFAILFVVTSLLLHRRGNSKMAYVMVALAAMIKMYPVLLMIGYLAYDIAKREYRSAFTSLMIFSVACLVIELPFLITDPTSAFNYLTYHREDLSR